MIDLGTILPSTTMCRYCKGKKPMRIITNFRAIGNEVRFKTACESGKHERLITVTDDDLGVKGRRNRQK